MDFDPTYLLLSLLISSVGYVLYRYGRTQRRFPHAAFGVTLMVFPYFVSDWRAMIAIAIALCSALWGVARFTNF
jgi:hypothetical protein